MKWLTLKTESDLQEALRRSAEGPVLLFKHSTRCSISSSALNRLEREWTGKEPTEAYFLDLIAHRDLSTLIASTLHVPHESPQAILVRDGQAVADWSHMAIRYGEVMAQAARHAV